MQGTLKAASEVSRLAAARRDAMPSLGAAMGHWKAIEAVVASASPRAAALVNAALDLSKRPSADTYGKVRQRLG